MEIVACAFILWLGLATSKLYGWQARDFWLEAWEKRAIVEFHDTAVKNKDTKPKRKERRRVPLFSDKTVHQSYILRWLERLAAHYYFYR